MIQLKIIKIFKYVLLELIMWGLYKSCNEMATRQISTKLMNDTLKFTEFSLLLLLFDGICQKLAEIPPAIIMGTCTLPIRKETTINRCCQTSWNLLHHFLGTSFQQHFTNILFPLVWQWVCILFQMDSLKGGKMLTDQQYWEKDRENSLKPYKSPSPKTEWQTSALKLEKGWKTFRPEEAYNPQFNSSCYYWITLRCHLTYCHLLKATETGKYFESPIAISESSRGILL